MLAPAAVLAALAVQAAPAAAPGTAWAGTWKCADPEVYATMVIAAVDASGFSLVWDENVGINGTRAEGSAKWLPGGGAQLVTDRCELTLAHTKDDRLLATMPEGSCFGWSSHRSLVFVREDVTVHEKASFDCRRAATPVERAVCANRDLAEADRQLASAYKTTAARAGDGRERLASAQRAWLSRRDRDCGTLAQPDGCLLRAYGRRLLELRAWPEAPFGPDDRPDVAVLTRVLVEKGGDAIARTGLSELAAGLVGGIPAGMDLAPRAEPARLAFSGCDEPDPARGWDPLGRNCGRTHYIAFLRNGETWAAWADADGVTIAPTPKARQKLPASLEEYKEDPWPADEDASPQP
jgi:uncharacterized protein YecT (DUF1311 family)